MNQDKKWDLSQFPIKEIRVATENDRIYGRFSGNNADDRALIESIKQRGILEPLVITTDYILLSGHRRLSAARAAVTCSPI